MAGTGLLVKIITSTNPSIKYRCYDSGSWQQTMSRRFYPVEEKFVQEFIGVESFDNDVDVILFSWIDVTYSSDIIDFFITSKPGYVIIICEDDSVNDTMNPIFYTSQISL